MITCQLSTLLGQRRWTQAELRARSGLSKATLSKLYHDRWTAIDRGTLEALCAALAVDISALLVWRPDDAP